MTADYRIRTLSADEAHGGDPFFGIQLGFLELIREYQMVSRRSLSLEGGDGGDD